MKARLSGRYTGYIKEILTQFLKFKWNKVLLFDNNSKSQERRKYLIKVCSQMKQKWLLKISWGEVISEPMSTNYPLTRNETSQLKHHLNKDVIYFSKISHPTFYFLSLSKYLFLFIYFAVLGLSCSMWDLPGPGIEPVSPALAGRFFTTEPPGKPRPLSLSFSFCLYLWCAACRIVP